MVSDYSWILVAGVVVVVGLLLHRVARYILGPIGHATYLDAPTRFQLSDVVWLLIELQVALAVCVQFVGLQSAGPFGIILAFLFLAVSAAWFGAMSFLSKIGVTSPRRRATFVLVVLPATVVLLILLPVLPVGGVVAAVQYLQYMRGGAPEFSIGLGSACAALIGGLLVAVAVGKLLRGLSAWVVAGSRTAEASQITSSQITPGS